MIETKQKSKTALEESAFLKACRLEKTPYTPIWLMRQAGRYMKEYREIREKVDFLSLCKNKELIAEVTIHAQEKIKADAAIIFSDILLLLEPFGVQLEYLKNDGPKIRNRVTSEKQIEQMPEIEPRESIPFVFESIKLTRNGLKPDIPLIGFAGAPFTLASYLIEGGASKDFVRTKMLMLSNEKAWWSLMNKMSSAIIKHLEAQIEAGVQAIQLFDSWAGVLSENEYETYAYPYSRKVLKAIQGRAPIIHFGTGTAPFLELLRDAGADVVGIDSKIPLDEAWKRIGYKTGIQGNLDPQDLFLPLSDLKKKVKLVLNQAKKRPGHIFNLGHGVLPETPVENVTALIDMVHEMSGK